MFGRLLQANIATIKKNGITYLCDLRAIPLPQGGEGKRLYCHEKKIISQAKSPPTKIKSLEDKLQRVYELADYLGYQNSHPEPANKYDKYGKHVYDLIFSYIDGLPQKWIMDMIEGRGSIKALSKFNLEKVEKDLDRDIALFEKIKREVKPQKTNNLKGLLLASKIFETQIGNRKYVCDLHGVTTPTKGKGERIYCHRVKSQ